MLVLSFSKPSSINLYASRPMKTKLSPLFIPFKTIFFSFSNKFCTDNIKKKKKKIENLEPSEEVHKSKKTLREIKLKN